MPNFKWIPLSFILRVTKLLQHHFSPTRLFPIPIDAFVSMEENNLILKYFLRKNSNQPSPAMLRQMILLPTNISSIPFIAPFQIFLLMRSVFCSFFFFFEWIKTSILDRGGELLSSLDSSTFSSLVSLDRRYYAFPAAEGNMFGTQI